MIKLKLNQAQMIAFVLVDSDCEVVDGLTNTYTLEVSKAGGAFAGSTGVKGEISDGWYHYTLTAAECDTIGPLAIKVTHASVVQQNLLFFVFEACVNCIEFTYTLTDAGTGLPIAGAAIDITTDVAGANIIWCGTTDAFGVARDASGNLPCIDAGTYYFWRTRAGYTFVNPDTEVVS